MRADNVLLNNFRNYESARIDFAPGINLITGDNAQGKTNLLEAVLFMCTGRSHRTANDLEFIRWGEEFFYIKGNFNTNALVKTIELSRNAKERRIKIDGKESRSLGVLLGCLHAVMFSPEDLRLIKDSPSERRRYINIMISMLSPRYYKLLCEYRRVVTQRNSLLKKIRSGVKQDFDELEAIDEVFLSLTSDIIRLRRKSIANIGSKAELIHKELTGGKEKVKLTYATEAAMSENREIIIDEFRKKIHLLRKDEIRRAQTLIGPHRDDMLVEINGKPARNFGSQGQQRTVVLTLKLAELEFVKDIKGEYPVFLLDDVMSELDIKRQEFLFETINSGMQVIMTGTEIENRSAAATNASRFRVVSGDVKQI